MAPSEIVLSASSSEPVLSSSSRPTSTPSIHVHDLITSAHLYAFKSSISSLNSVSYVPTQQGTGGVVLAVQDGKALVNVWAWQRDQILLKLHLPEKLSCFSASPNGCWAVGGSVSGHLYLWELASGLLLVSFNAHYRAITSLTFTSDSHLLLSASLDSSIHVFLVSRLVGNEDTGNNGKPYGTLRDHTLSVRAVTVGRTASSSGGRCWTASEDGTVKMWSLHPPFELLCTFSFPPSIVPTTIVVDSAERFFYVGSTQGHIYHVELFRRRAELGMMAGEVESIGGGGPGAPPFKAEAGVISHKSSVTCLALSISSTHLLVGTHAGDIHVHSLPSHQHLRTILSHASPITHLSTLLRPSDLIGAGVKLDSWPVMEIKPLERMRIGKSVEDVQEVTILLRSNPHVELDTLRPLRPDQLPGVPVDAESSDKLAELVAENKRLHASLDRAVKINERMWNGIIDLKLAQPEGNGHAQ
ncbi:MAG: Pre-rRNA-processing protein ipi3 [Tremellales sp. Tagirdzhanova-0007]|nr:MAG: Pre-rRNA-processing protein ipi3 [Tremellales sp. Tagirdzhanova-0007]